MTYSVRRAPAIESARKRSAGVLPSVGAVDSSPAAWTPPSHRSRSNRLLTSSPVASAHAAANAAWSCRTAAAHVRAVLHDPQVARAERTECHRPHTRLAQRLPVRARHAVGAERVEQEEHLHPRARAIDEELAQPVGDASA